MGRIKINDLTNNNKIRVRDMLEGYTYRITYNTGDSYDVLVCYAGGINIPYAESSERIVTFLEDGAINIINEKDIIEIMETYIEMNITNSRDKFDF